MKISMGLFLFCISFLLVLFSAIAIELFYNNKFSSYVDISSCDSKITLIHGDLRFHGLYKFNFFSDVGDVTMNGVVNFKGKDFIVNRQISFTFKKNNNNFLLKSVRVERFSQDSALASGIDQHLPDFFVSSGNELPLELNFDNDKNPIFYLGVIPLFYCQR